MAGLLTRALLTLAIVSLTNRCLADGINDIQFFGPGQSPVQSGVGQLPTPAPGPCCTLSISPRLADRIRLPNQVAVQPLAAAAVHSLSADQCPTHVHRFFYSGNSQFQCPIIQGGRTRVVTVHPKTGEPIEFFVMLADGAPRVIYRSDHFAYVYPDHSTVVRFPSVGPLQPRVTVTQHNGRTFGQHFHDAADWVEEKHDQIQQTNMVQAIKTATQEGKDALMGSGVLVDRAVGGTIDASRRITDLLPGKAYIQSLSEQRALDSRDAAIRETQRSASALGRFIPSNK